LNIHIDDEEMRNERSLRRSTETDHFFGRQTINHSHSFIFILEVDTIC